MKPHAVVAALLVLAAGCGSPKKGAPDPNADADSDGIVDTAEGRAARTDTDGDTTPDYLDLDSDDDTIADAVEAGDTDLATAPVDTDSDATADFRDLDSDADCVSDESEARGAPPADTDGDGRADFRDRDSDGDGLADGAEDASCSGTVEAGETSAIDGDTDGDGADDLVETALGTDPGNASDNPEANGDAVVILPHQGAPAPAERDLSFAPAVQAVDVYVLLDRSGSMTAESAAIRNNLAVAIDGLRCPPLGSGDPATCIPDLWAGAGAIGYQDSGADAFRNFVDVQPNPIFTALPTTEPSSMNFSEPLTFAAYAAVTGEGGSAYGMNLVPARATCAGSPAANAGFATFGYPCFREGAIPVVVMATDEPPITPTTSVYLTPAWSTVVRPAFLARQARFVGVYGSGPVNGTITDLQTMATDTGAVDATNGNAPIVVNGADANAAAALQNAIQTLANGTPFLASALAIDDPADAVDAPVAFVSRLETQATGPDCTAGLTTQDADGDGFPDEYVAVVPRTPLCWKLVPKPNAIVAAVGTAQVFGMSVAVQADGVTELDRRDVFFVVPPLPLD